MSPTPGQILLHARQERGLTLEAVSEATHIRLRYLQALEADDLPGLPSLVQAKGFLRLYAGFLGLDEASLVDQFSRQAAPPVAPQPASPAVPDLDQPPPAVSTVALPPPPTRSEVGQTVSPPSEPSDQTPPAGKASQRIFDEIGQDLRDQRERLSLSLLEVEKHIHVRTHYLKALEEGRMQDMPSFVQARGMLANYAHFLNLDSEAYLLRFADALQTRRLELAALQEPARKANGASKSNGNPLLKRILSVDLLVTGGLIVILVTFVTWGASRVLTLQAQQKVTQTQPAVVDILQTSPTAVETLRPGSVTTGTALEASPSGAAVVPPEPTLAISLPAPGEGAIQLSVIARQRAWLQVQADGKMIYNGRTTPGNAYNFSGNKQVELRTGSGSALQVFFNGSDLGVLGAVGQVVDLIFTPGGLANPTPSLTPAVTPTPRVTKTPTSTVKPAGGSSTAP